MTDEVPLTAPAYFHVAFAPNIKLVSTVRRFTGEFYRRVLVDHELSSRVALATHEMLENAVAYATDGETGVRIEIDGDDLVIRTWNRAAPENMAQLETRIAEMNRAPDAEAYYLEMLDRTARRPDGSGLGLARVRAEADMTITCEREADERVCVVARTPCRPPG